VLPPTPETRDTESAVGEREKAGVWAAFSGGKEVWRKGWLEVADVVESIEALRRFIAGAADGMSDCLRFGGWGSCALDG
jgi:hypothetical protein